MKPSESKNPGRNDRNYFGDLKMRIMAADSLKNLALVSNEVKAISAERHPCVKRNLEIDVADCRTRLLAKLVYKTNKPKY